MNMSHTWVPSNYVQIIYFQMLILTFSLWNLFSIGAVWDVKFSGDRVVTCGEDGTIRIWDGWTGHCLAVLSGHLDAVLSVSLRQIPGLCSSNVCNSLNL